jgi:hypothetical protein
MYIYLKIIYLYINFYNNIRSNEENTTSPGIRAYRFVVI